MEQENTSQLKQITESLNDISESLKKDPRAEQYHSETHCPSCGRFVGTETRCPYCQTETQKRLPIRIFKIISVLISTLGLLMLLFYARNVKTTEVKIKELGPLSNFAHVRIIGTVIDGNGQLSKWGSLNFTVIQKDEFKKDGYKIRVSAYNKTAKLISEMGNIPSKGDIVEFEGQVRAQKGDLSILINSAEHIKIIERSNKNEIDDDDAPFITSSSLIQITPNDVTNELIKKPVKVEGVVKEAYAVENDCSVITIENNNPQGLKIFITDFSNRELTLPKAGDKIEVIGLVTKYKGILEIEVNKQGNYRILGNK